MLEIAGTGSGSSIGLIVSSSSSERMMTSLSWLSSEVKSMRFPWSAASVSWNGSCSFFRISLLLTLLELSISKIT